MRGKLRIKKRGARTPCTFNEARALCAGNSPPKTKSPLEFLSFNEARALCAGNCASERKFPPIDLPSMRPALYARETRDRAVQRVGRIVLLQ